MALTLALLALGSCAPGDRETSKSDRDTVGTLSAYRDSTVIELTGIDSTTVLELLKAAHTVDYRSTLTGSFVTSIDGVEAGSDYFWVYSVNDSSPSVACDEYITVDGDRVKWHFRKFGE